MSDIREIFRKISYQLEDMWMSVRLRSTLNNIKSNKAVWIAFSLGFILTLSFVSLTLERNSQVKNLKAGLLQLQDGLNEFGLDIAYDKIKFSSVFTRPLFEVENFTFYSPRQQWRLLLPKLKIVPAFFSFNKFIIAPGPDFTITSNGEAYKGTAENTNIEVSLNKSQIKLLMAEIRNIDIKKLAKIQELNLAGRQTGYNNNLKGVISSFENHLEMKNITLNGLLNYPLTSQISRLYLKTNLMGTLKQKSTFTLSMQDWLRRGGLVEISNLIVNWDSFSLVGRGELNFDEALHPNLHLETSSKALIRLLDELQQKEVIERKGVFVAKILLSNKAFKLKENDTALTVTTPIDYRDGKLAVENVTIRRFGAEKQQ